MSLIRLTSDAIVNKNDISAVYWDRKPYYSSHADELIVSMNNGVEIRIQHQPYALGGIDCYEIEKKLLDSA